MNAATSARDADTAPDLRLLPAALAGWGGAWTASGALWAVGAAVVGLAVAAAGVAFALSRIGSRQTAVWASVAMVAPVVLGVGGLHAFRLSSGPVFELAEQRAMVSAQLVTSADPWLRPAGPVRSESLAVRARLSLVDGRGERWRVGTPVLVLVSGPSVSSWRAAPVGAHWEVVGRLEAAEPGSGLAATLGVRQSSLVAPPAAGLQLVERVRDGLRRGVQQRGADTRGLVPALVLGDTSALPPDLVNTFKVAGLTHLTAVSGANLTLLLAFLLFVARWSGVRGWWLRGVGLLGVVVFVALCRTEPSVLRAAAMGLVALAAVGLGGGRAGTRNLAVTVLALLLLDPYLSRSYGFALSVLASAGIIWWARRWTVLLRSWLPTVVAEAIAVPLAAQLATTPVVAQLSGAISVVGLLANALAGPFVGPATVLGFATAGLSLISDRAAAVAGFGAAWSAQPIVWVGRAAARLPGAAASWPASPLAIGVLVVVAVVVGSTIGMVLGRRWLSCLVAAVLVVALLRPPTGPGWPPPGWVLVACNVGQGDGLVVNLGRGLGMVVDTGPDRSAMDRCLARLRVRQVPLLVLTHFHADHVDGLSGVLDHRHVSRIWVSPLASPAAEVSTVQALAARSAIPIEVPAVGSQGRLGPATWTVLGPIRPVPRVLGSLSGPESSVENDASLVITVDVAGVRMLLTGDVEPLGQAAMLDAGSELRADVLKVPHHGSSRQDRRFLAATGARFAIASAGIGNDYGHPASSTIAALTDSGATVLRTDTSGSVAVVAGRDGRLIAVGGRDQPPARR